MTGAGQSGAAGERRTLWIVFVLNAGLAIAFLIAGVTADSNALLANGLDNLSDAAVSRRHALRAEQECNAGSKARAPCRLRQKPQSTLT